MAESLLSRIFRLGRGPVGPAVRRQRMHSPAMLDRPLAIEDRISADPGNPRLWTALGFAFLDVDDVDQATQSFQRAAELDPGHADTLTGLGNAARERGRGAEAIKFYQQALNANPKHHVAFENLLFSLLCSDDYTEEEIFAWHRSFSRQFEAPLAARITHENLKEPDRRLSIGYVSPDLRKHVVGRSMIPLFERHDHASFKVHCYFSCKAPDELSQKIAAHCDEWRDVSDLSDSALADVIRRDGIDVLVDLSGHTPGNRLLAFARRPAPVQVTYLDYSATTGMSSLDYRITDRVCDPVGIADAYYSEKLVRLSTAYLLYNPPLMNEARSETVRRDSVGLICANSFSRVTDEAHACWIRIANALPQVHITFVGVPDGSSTQELVARYSARGIAPERLHVFGYLPYEEYVELIRANDIALGPFPYNGAMSTLDCLWHGLPVVCRAGRKTFHSRMGQSILGVLGLTDLVASTADAYVDVVTRLIEARERRHELRQGLRSRIRTSALQDFDGFTREIEKAYREMWRTYCNSPTR